MGLPVHSSTTVVTATGSVITIASHVVSGTNAALIVKVALKSPTVTIFAVNWDDDGVNEALTLLNTVLENDARSALYYLGNPTAKTADVTVELSGGSAPVVAAASTYTGVDQSNPFRTAAAATNGGFDSSPQLDIVASNDEMVVDALCQVSDGPDTAAGDHTERHDDAQLDTGDDVRGASQEKASTGATETMSWTMNFTDDWSMCAGPLRGPQSEFIPLVDMGGLAGKGGLAGSGGGLIG